MEVNFWLGTIYTFAIMPLRALALRQQHMPVMDMLGAQKLVQSLSELKGPKNPIPGQCEDVTPEEENGLERAFRRSEHTHAINS